MARRGNLTLVSTAPDDPFERAKARLTGLLIDHCLVGTFTRCRDGDLPYRFTAPETVYPGRMPAAPEDPARNTALVICVDGALPPPLRKHFRLRSSNRVTWRNIHRLLPDSELGDYEYLPAHNRLDAPEIRALLARLLPLDYALLVERPLDESSAPQDCELTHLHVKVERITDNAIRDLGRRLGYVQRNLFERGEDYVEALEAKFFEYHGFPAHASGRQAAAAMAAQLLHQHAARFAVFVASQESGRLTVLDETDSVTQYLLVEADARLTGHFGQADPTPYLAPGGTGPAAAAIRLQLQRTAAALPHPRRNRDADIMAPWLSIAAQHLMPLGAGDDEPLPYAWAEA